MRVRGSKQRVRLTEVELEPSEQKPMLRIAPAAASLIWLGSIALATAIYMEWLPARALFEAETRAPPGRPVRNAERLRPQELEASAPSTAAAAGIVAAADIAAAPPLADATAAPATAPAADTPVLPPETAISTPPTVPESSRVIRGSYYSEDSSWAAGW